MSNNGRTNNLKSIKNNYANTSSSSGDDDDDNDGNNNTITDTDKNASMNPTSSSSNYKILTPFVPYKNPFVVDEEEAEELEDKNDAINDELLLSERDSKRQKSEFNSSSKLSSQSSTTKVYRTKVSPPSNNSNKSDSTSDDNDDSDVDLSSVTINPKLLENDGGTSSKRKRQDSQPHLDEETSNASTFMSDDLSMESDNEPLLLRKPSSVTTKLSSIEEAPEESLLAETSLDTKSNQYWRRACTSSTCFGLNDIINREFGYSSRPGHGTRCSLNLFNSNVTETTSRRGRLIYDNQLQTPRHFIRKAMSGLSYVRKMRLTQNLSFHEGCVNSLNFNRLGTMLASGSDDFQVCLWDWAKNCLVLNFDSGHKSNV